MKIFCTPKALKFFQNDKRGPSTQQRVNNWLEAHEVSPGQPCMSGQVEHFRFRETEPQIGLDINWISFRINDAGRLIGAVVNVPGIGLCFFALDWAQNHDFQNTLVDKADLRQSYLKSITPFLKSFKEMAASSKSDKASTSSSSEATLQHSNSFQRMVQHQKYWISPDVTQIELMDVPILQGMLCFAPPGAGKTMIAVQRAIAYAQAGLRVAMLSPTQLLAETLRIEFAQQGMADSVRVLTFEDVLMLSGEAQGQKRLVDFEFFKQWCAKRPKILDKQNSQKKILFNTALTAGESLLWQEFEYVFMQTPDWRNPSDAYLSESQYCGLGTEQSRITQEQRGNIYQSVFEPFLADIQANPKLYYPPLKAHEFHQHELPSELKVDALVLDEVQKLHPWVSTCFLKLLKQPLAAGRFFICGDAHQGAECQQLRVSETLTNYLVGQRAQFSVNQLLVNYRSSQAVTRVVLQIHAIEMELLGSIERVTHLSPKINCEAQEGSVEVVCDDADIQQQVASDPEAYVLIPDESYRAEAVLRWPEGQVVSLSEFSGLSGDTIVMYGFGEFYHEDLRLLAIHFNGELPSGHKKYSYTRKDNNISLRTCLQALYIAVSRAIIKLYIIDTNLGFLKQIVDHASVRPLADIATFVYEPVAIREPTPQEWFERARKDFRNGLNGQAKAILSDERRMGDACQKINEALQSFELANILSMPFKYYLPPEAIVRPCRHQSKSRVQDAHPMALLEKKYQKFVNQFSDPDKLTTGNLQKIVAMKDKIPQLRERLLFIAAVGNSKESIFIKYLAAKMNKQFIETMKKTKFLDEITSLGLNHLSQSGAYPNMSLACLLFAMPDGRALLESYPRLVGMITPADLDIIFPGNNGASVESLLARYRVNSQAVSSASIFSAKPALSLAISPINGP